jgi:hypothetical protein
VTLSTTTQRRWAYGRFAGGAAGVAAGGVLVGLALDAQGGAQGVADTLSRSHVIQENDRQNHNDAISRRDDYRLAAATVLAGGAALLSLSALLYIFDEPSLDDEKRSNLPLEGPASEDKERSPELDLLAGGGAGSPGFMLRLRF